MDFIKMLRSFGYAFTGVKTALKMENNFKFQVLASILIIIIGFYLKFSYFEWLAIGLCIVLVLSFELANTSIERILDKFSPEYSQSTKEIKDIAAGSVLIAATGAGAIGLIIIINHL